MAVPISMCGRQFVTDLQPEDIRQEEQALKHKQILYLEVPNDENGTGNIEIIDGIFVGLQKTEHTIRRCSNVEQCFTYIGDGRDMEMYVILSQTLAEDEMSALKQCSNVVFIYDFSSPYPWIKEQKKSSDPNSFRPVFDQINIHHRQFHGDAASGNSTDFLPQNHSTDSGSFIKYQLLMAILFRLPITEDSKQEFINWCLQNYSQNPKDKEAINKFAQTLSRGQAIRNYTEQSFANRILGRTFATNDLRRIYKIRYFVRHLYEEIQELHAITCTVLGSKITVYRGKTMSIGEFDTLKASIGKLVITKSFVSTSLTKDVAIMFSGDREVTTGNVAVIFRMIIDKVDNKSKAYAYIGDRSKMAHEDEVLLGPGIVFLNKEIRKEGENMFIIELVRTSAEEEIEERVISSNADYLREVEDPQSPEAFHSLFDNLSQPLNDQVPPEPFRIHNDEQNNRTMEQQPITTTQNQTTQETREQFAQRRPEPREISSTVYRRLWKEINQIQETSNRDGSSAIFIVDQSFFDDDEEELISNVLIGRLFPRSNIYNECAYRIEISFPAGYPLVPPEVRFLTPIYHPNIGRNGEISLNILQRNGSWLPTMSLSSVLEAVVDIIDHPDTDSPLNTEAAVDYVENRAEFERKSLETARRYGYRRQ